MSIDLSWRPYVHAIAMALELQITPIWRIGHASVVMWIWSEATDVEIAIDVLMRYDLSLPNGGSPTPRFVFESGKLDHDLNIQMDLDDQASVDREAAILHEKIAHLLERYHP